MPMEIPGNKVSGKTFFADPTYLSPLVTSIPKEVMLPALAQIITPDKLNTSIYPSIYKGFKYRGKYIVNVEVFLLPENVVIKQYTYLGKNQFDEATQQIREEGYNKHIYCEEIELAAQ